MKTRYFFLSLIGVLFLSTLILDQAFAATDLSQCGFFDVNHQCDLSGLAHLLIGDLIVGGMFGFVFFLFTERNNRAIQAIVKRDFDQANNRKDFAVKNLKGTINLLIFTMGLMKKLTTLYNMPHYVTPKDNLEKKILMNSHRFENFLNAVRHGLFYSSDVLEPDIIYKTEEICLFLSFIQVTFENGVATYEKYDAGKEKLHLLYRILNTYENESHTFGFIDEDEVFDVLKDVS